MCNADFSGSNCESKSYQSNLSGVYLLFLIFKACVGHRTSLNGTITSPGYPTNYQNNLNCTWIIENPNATIFSINFLEFQTEPYWDYVSVHDGISLESPISYTGYPSLPLKIVSSGNMVMIHFTSDGSGTASGFLMTYEGLQGVETTTEGMESACILYFHYYMPSY